MSETTWTGVRALEDAITTAKRRGLSQRLADNLWVAGDVGLAREVAALSTEEIAALNRQEQR